MSKFPRLRRKNTNTEILMKPLLLFLKTAFLTKYASVSGRTSRSEARVFAGICAFLLAIPVGLHAAGTIPLFGACWLFCALTFWLILPTLALEGRRLHDLNESARTLWAWLLFPVGPIGLSALCLLKKGTVGPNRFEEEPPGTLLRNRNLWAAVGIPMLILWPQFSESTAPISAVTHLETKPRLADGSVNYFAAEEALWEADFADPEKNGFRLLALAVGDAPFRPLPVEPGLTAEKEAGIQRDWLVTCRRLELEPDLTPRFPNPDPLPVLRFMDPVSRNALLEGLEPHPEATAWLERFSPLLDLTAEAVRKPYFMPGLAQPNPESVFADEQLNLWPFDFCQRLSQALLFRAACSLKAGNANAAAQDALTVFRLGFHVARGPESCPLLAIELEAQADDLVQKILESGLTHEALLTRLAAELDAIPFRPNFAAFVRRESLFIFSWEQAVLRGKRARFGGAILKECRPLSRWVDEEELRKTFAKGLTPFLALAEETDPFLRAEKAAAIPTPGLNPLEPVLALTARGRGKAAACGMLREIQPDEQELCAAFQASETRRKCVRIAIEIELFRLWSGRLPVTLEELGMPETFLRDPFTKNSPLTYVQDPNAAPPWRVFSPHCFLIPEGSWATSRHWEIL